MILLVNFMLSTRKESSSAVFSRVLFEIYTGFVSFLLNASDEYILGQFEARLSG